MPLHTTSPARERILVMGAHGAGKTRAWLTIAKYYEKFRSDGTFFVLDTDMAVRRMLDGENFGSLADRTQYMIWDPGRDTFVPDGATVTDPRLIVYEPYEWVEYMDGLKQITAAMDNNDWLIVDLANPVWDAVQDHYIDHIFKKSSADFYLAAREANKKGNALDGDKDWSSINRMYREFSQRLLRLRGHLFLVTGIKAVTMDGNRADPKEIRVMFGPHGVKPEGQKQLPHMAHTILLLKEFSPGVYTMTSVKDREREMIVGDDLNDFVMQYLVPVAKWKLA